MTTFVIGLDGADWSLIDRFADEGHLPAFDRLRSDGTTGELETTLPPLTSPAWQSFATGKNPGKLGVYGWMTFDHDTQEIDFTDATKYRSDRFWDVLAREGYSVGVVNVPTTFPPESENGVSLIAGNGALRDREFTSPRSLKTELLEQVPEYRIMMHNSVNEDDPDQLINEAMTLFDQRFEAVRWLVNEKGCDVVVVTLFHIDTVQHNLWHDLNAMRPVYEHVDRHLGALLDDKDTDGIFLLSDHGFREMDSVFLPNQWLLERGDITIRGSGATGGSRQLLHRLGITREQFMHLFDRLGIEEFMAHIVPLQFKRAIPHNDSLLPIQEANVDWEHTRAISLGRGPVFVNSRAFDSESDRQAYVDDLQIALEELTLPSGDPVVDQVYRPDEIWDGDRGHRPDLLIDYAEGVDGTKVGIDGPVFDLEARLEEWSGQHRRTGIFAAHGADIVTGKMNVSIYDVAPTILHYLDAPVPEDVDGSVRKSAFAGERAARDVVVGPPTATDKDEDTPKTEDDVAETLRDLGYLG